MQEKTTVTAEQFDSGLIFSRALALMNSQNIQVEHILSYELAPVPTSMFDEKMRKLHIIAKSTSILKNKVQAEQSARATGQLDGWLCHTLGYSLAKQGKRTRSCESKLKGNTRVHVIFDHYCEYSIKSEPDALVNHKFLVRISCVSALLCYL